MAEIKCQNSISKYSVEQKPTDLTLPNAIRTFHIFEGNIYGRVDSS